MNEWRESVLLSLSSFSFFSQIFSACCGNKQSWRTLSASLLTNFFADFSTAQLLFHYFVVCLLDAWCTQLSAQLLHSALHSLCRLINHLTAEQLSSTSTFSSSTLLAHLAGTLISSHLDSSAEWSSLGVLSLTDCLSVWFWSLAAHCVFPISSLILVLCTVWQATHSNWASAASTITACYDYYCLIRLQLLSSHTHTLSDVSISSVPFASCLSRSQSFFVCDSFSLSSSVASQFVSRLSVCAPAASLCYTCTADSFLSLFSLFSSLFPFFSISIDIFSCGCTILHFTVCLTDRRFRQEYSVYWVPWAWWSIGGHLDCLAAASCLSIELICFLCLFHSFYSKLFRVTHRALSLT